MWAACVAVAAGPPVPSSGKPGRVPRSLEMSAMKPMFSGAAAVIVAAGSLLAVSVVGNFGVSGLQDGSLAERMAGRRGTEMELAYERRLIGVWRHPAGTDEVVENAAGMYDTSLRIGSDGTFSSAIRFYDPVVPVDEQPRVVDVQGLSGVYEYRDGFIELGGEVYSIRFEGMGRVRFTANGGAFNDFSRVE